MSSFTLNSVPSVNIQRSRFNIPEQHKTTLDVGDLVPFWHKAVVPGDQFDVDVKKLLRVTSSFVKVPMDSLYADMRFFYVRNRTIYDQWVNLMGESKSAWVDAKGLDYEVPKCTFKNDFTFVQSIADYLGMAPEYTDIGSNLVISPDVSDLYFRAFAKIYDDWFRDQNNQDPMNIDTTEAGAEANIDAWGPDNYHGMPPKVGKFMDYFTGCLPSAQKGAPVTIGLAGSAPVYSSSGDNPPPIGDEFANGTAGASYSVGMSQLDDWVADPAPGALGWDDLNGGIHTSSTTLTDTARATFSNLKADLSGASGVTINDLRFSFQLQKMFERDARGGTRYTETIRNHFGVINPDADLQRAEYLGGSRTPIFIDQVTQNSVALTSTSTQLADVAGRSITPATGGFRKAFVDFGVVMGVMCIRQKHTYQQGIHPELTQFKRLDFYDPLFANIGEQPVLTKEIYGDASNTDTFGFLPAWEYMRVGIDRTSGYMRSTTSGGSLDIWHFGDLYGEAPTLGSDFIEETKEFVGRTLAIQTEGVPQFIADIFVTCNATRPLPTYSVPSRIDLN